MLTRVRSAVLAATVNLMGPALGTSEAAYGGDGNPDAILYELTEHVVLTDTLRLATSALDGSARRGSAPCPDGLQAYAKELFATVGVRVRVDPRCAIVALGDSQISLTSFGGQISGSFWVVVNSAATNLTDAQELVIMNASLSRSTTSPSSRTIEVGRFRYGAASARWAIQPCASRWTSINAVRPEEE